jgi:hypothetical protein
MKIPRQRKSRHNRRQDKVFVILQSVVWTIGLLNN